MKFRGAEAIVETIHWNGIKSISKTRNTRSYRHPKLEKRLVKERMRSECRSINRLISHGVPVPAIYSVDVTNSQIYMEFLEGVTLEKALRTKDYSSYLSETANLLSLIHSIGIVHGDPTTSNFIVNDIIYAIDFGLSFMSCDDEARASDLRVLLESLEAHHSDILGRETFLQVYAQWEGSYSVIQAFQILEQRGRYNLMRG